MIRIIQTASATHMYFTHPWYRYGETQTPDE